MNYGLLFLGIGLVIVAVILFIIEAVKNRSEIRELEIANAQTELLIEELNELSSIIVDEMDKKYNNMLSIYREMLTTSEPVQEDPQQDKDKSKSAEGMQPRDRKNTILELHSIGKSPQGIAERLGIGVGEVELIIKFAERGVGKNDKNT
ncbi:MAG: hypothetical protein WCS98_00280 [Bacillota bacterium]|nr:hypothetical protein [Bacillota bacterium]MDD3297311.1 hypothetical protein [Bacillota bacterium]MDD3850104.1 hypothetical protein [Bacillota bacterium]MDD4706827.1 hypothetical protein [Bacillota bacterium]